jgi:hypothetical protein
MKNNIKSKIILFLILITIISPYTFIKATSASINPISNEEHKQIINNYLNKIEALQNQVDAVAQTAISGGIGERELLRSRISVINTHIENLNSIIQDYLAANPGVSERNRHIILTFNIINLVKSNLYTLSELIDTTNDVDQFLLFNEYFSTRVNTLNTLEILRQILAKYSL